MELVKEGKKLEGDGNTYSNWWNNLKRFDKRPEGSWIETKTKHNIEKKCLNNQKCQAHLRRLALTAT